MKLYAFLGVILGSAALVFGSEDEGSSAAAKRDVDQDLKKLGLEQKETVHTIAEETKERYNILLDLMTQQMRKYSAFLKDDAYYGSDVRNLGFAPYTQMEGNPFMKGDLNFKDLKSFTKVVLSFLYPKDPLSIARGNFAEQYIQSLKGTKETKKSKKGDFLKRDQRKKQTVEFVASQIYEHYLKKCAQKDGCNLKYFEIGEMSRGEETKVVIAVDRKSKPQIDLFGFKISGKKPDPKSYQFFSLHWNLEALSYFETDGVKDTPEGAFFSGIASDLRTRVKGGSPDSSDATEGTAADTPE